nr:type II secretion system protein GspM [Polymorphobacter sp.]
MMAMVMPWWRDRTRREQWLLAVMGALLAVVVLWLGVMRPLAVARDAAAARHLAAVTGLGDVQAMGGAIRRAEARGGAAVPLVELVSQRASEAGLTAERMETSGDGRVTVRIAAVRPVVMLRWLGDIEARDGVVVERVTINRNDDATLAVELALRSAGG